MSATSSCSPTQVNVQSAVVEGKGKRNTVKHAEQGPVHCQVQYFGQFSQQNGRGDHGRKGGEGRFGKMQGLQEWVPGLFFLRVRGCRNVETGSGHRGREDGK
jgi:hypothetical protein